MTRLPASMRTKRRYVLIRGASKATVEHALLAALGSIGWARASPLFVSVREMNDVVISIDRGALDAVRVALELAPVGIRIIRVSGTIKGLGKRS